LLALAMATMALYESRAAAPKPAEDERPDASRRHHRVTIVMSIRISRD
jgi:hypothetical protein